MSDVEEPARAAAHAIRQMCRATSARPSMTPAEVDDVLAHLTEAVAALPQATRQLGDILDRARDGHLLEMDGLTRTRDADLAIDTARLALDAAGDTANDLHRSLDAARNEAAHIRALDSEEGSRGRSSGRPPPPVRRPEEREPPPTGGSGIGAPPR